MRVVRGLVVVTLAGAVAAVPLDHLEAVASARQKSTDAGLRQQSKNAAPGEEPALVRARRTGQPAEVEALRSETRQVFVKPDGTYLLEQNVRPVRVRQAGGWVPVDTTLREQPDGTVAPVATAVGPGLLRRRHAATAALRWPACRAAARRLELGWSGTLPKPVLNGDTATYPEVMPGVDLQVTADVDGFSHLLVVKSRAAAANKRPVRADVPALDQRPVDGVGPGRATWRRSTQRRHDLHRADPDDVGLRGGHGARRRQGRSRRRRPGRRDGRRNWPAKRCASAGPGMMTDPKTRFPIYLDPYFSAARGSWTAVWSNRPTPTT